MSGIRFPTHPTHGMIVDVGDGVFFRYDSSIVSWIRISSNTVATQVATNISNGLMSAADFKKLNRLLLSPPNSSIIGNDCVSPFTSGNISFESGDNFIDVNSNVDIKNIDQYGQTINLSMPFQIHAHTYGIDFSIDLPQLVDELKKRNQYNVVGRDGDIGDVGDVGEDGLSFVLAGPPGDAGPDGGAPNCGLSIQSEPIQIEPINGLSKALVNVKVVVDSIDKSRYKLVFDRQSIGSSDRAADRFIVDGEISPWVLAVAPDVGSNSVDDVTVASSECGYSQVNSLQLYHIDIEAIVEAIRNEFINEVNALKAGYEFIVSNWLQTMSDLFDAQKAALCCALQSCMSVTKNAELRRHMESVAASAAGDANIALHGRDDREAVSLSSTRSLTPIGGPDLCAGGPRFPQQSVVIPATVSRSSQNNQQPVVEKESLNLSVQNKEDFSVAQQINVPEKRNCVMSLSHLTWYERGWVNKTCCGVVINILGQDYIIFKRSIGLDTGCGGGESLLTPCVAEFANDVGHPAFAWPTFDGVSFVQLPESDIVFCYDENLSGSAYNKIMSGDYKSPVGSPNGLRHLSYQLSVILFPMSHEN